MKKLKIALLIATLSLVGGIVIFVIGLSVLKWDFGRLDVTEYTQKQYVAETPELIGNIDIKLNSFPLTVKLGEGVSLDYYEASDSAVSVSVEGNTLRVAEEHNFKYNPFNKGLFDFSRLKHKFVLTVPNNKNVKLSGANCKFETRGMEFTELNIDVTNLDIDCNDCTFGTLSVKSTNLDLNLARCSAQTLTVDSTNSDVELYDCNIPDIAVDSTNSEVQIKGATAQKIELSSTNGDYDLEAVTTDNLTLDATNLNAEIDIRGKKSEYTIRTEGRNLPREQMGATDKIIYLKGINCDVELSFTE